MKKFVTIIIALLLASIAANAQLSGVTVEEAAGYRTVYEHQTIALAGSAVVRYIDGEYILFGDTDNRFEKSMASIYLGDTKESAILTLEDLRKIAKKEVAVSDLVVRGFDGKKTTMIKGPIGGAAAIFSTEGVAGQSYILWTLRNRFEDVKQAIANFEESYE